MRKRKLSTTVSYSKKNKIFKVDSALGEINTSLNKVSTSKTKSEKSRYFEPKYNEVSDIGSNLSLPSQVHFDETQNEIDFNERKRRVLEKVQKMIAPLKTDNETKINDKSNNSNIIIDNSNQQSIRLKFKPFEGDLPSFIPLNISDDEL